MSKNNSTSTIKQSCPRRSRACAMGFLLVSAALTILLAFGCGSKQPPPQQVETIQQEEPAPEPKPAPTASTDPAHFWDLTQLYPSDGAWKKELKDVEARIPEIEALAGTLGKNGESLKKALDTYFEIKKDLARLFSYAGQRFDEDTRDAKGLEMQQQVRRSATEISQKGAFFEPEILEVGQRKVDRFLAKDQRMEKYRFFLEDILRRKPHTLDKEGEEILAATGLISGTANTLYSLLSNAEIPWPTVTLSDGAEVRLDSAAYTKYRSVPNREDRIKVFDAFWKKWADFEQTMGAALDAQMRQDLFYSQVRKYPNCLSAALDAGNVPEDVYRMLVKSTNDNLSTLHRYLKLRKRILGVDELHYHDAYTSLVASSDRVIPIKEGEQMVLDALKPLGEDYVATVKGGFENRWMDVYPREGKSSGAYSNGAAYDVHPYVLTNYTDDYESVSTMAHEFGHAMHSYLANKAQPFATADYNIFVAEVASTFNEGLLLEKALKNAKTDEEKLFYLGSALEGLRTTFFRQTMFAEFELAIHESAEKGEPLTGKRLTEMYKELVRRYHGHDKGIMIVDDAYALEWAYIPHFYYNFYVYQYATSLAASSLFVKEVLDGKEGARDRYLNVLKAGGSRFPYEILKTAGVDLATPAPYEALMARMNAIMDQIEEILNRKK
jgi:oligoendopeptidase F